MDKNISKTIIFYTYEVEDTYSKYLYGYKETLEAINNNEEEIRTTQMCLLSTDLFDKGYEVWIHEFEEDIFEITLGECERTNRKLKMSHNLFKLWRAREFL